MNDKARNQTHFGFRQVAEDEKAGLVHGVFSRVASKYDVMNDLMSVGIHRIWKNAMMDWLVPQSGQHLLDVAGGTGDIAAGMARQVGERGLVVLSDINEAMLGVGRNRLLDRGLMRNVRFSLANAECLPFADESFDCVTIAFGLRNVTDKPAALASMRRVLRPGGRLLVLEFSKPVVPGLKPIYDVYSFSVLPWLGAKVAGDSDSYQYLAESIRKFPDQETLKGMMQSAGLEDVSYHNLTGGIVALHKGFRY